MKTYAVGQVPSGYAPLPPENVLINDARYPADISGQYTISWAPNPREHVHGPAVSGDETYTLRLYDETDTLRRTVTGITGNSYTWSTEVADSQVGGVLDTFDVDSTANYTQYANTAGTWAVSGGELVATGGSQALFIRNGTSYTDISVEADMNYAHNGGLILRFIDNDNYYMVTLSDDSGGATTANAQLFKRVTSTFTQIGSNVNLNWPRGTSAKIKFQAAGTTLSVYFDDTLVITETDSSIAGPGGVGMRNSDGGSFMSKYQSFRHLEFLRYNSSIRAELETVRGGVTSYQKQVIKSTRSVTTP